MMSETILYLSDQATNGNSVPGALRAAGYEVVSTNSANQAIALLYLLHTVVGVVVSRLTRGQNRVDVVRNLHAIRPEVPIVLLCSNQMMRLPSFVDACVDAGQPLEKLIAAVRRLFLAKRFQLLSAQH